MALSIDQVAELCHEQNRAYCALIGDDVARPWHEAAAKIRQSAVDGVLHAIRAPNHNPRESHENWLAFKEANGWRYGIMKNEATKEHPCFMPYDDLPEDQKAKDYLFLGVVSSLMACNAIASLRTSPPTDDEHDAGPEKSDPDFAEVDEADTPAPVNDDEVDLGDPEEDAGPAAPENSDDDHPSVKPKTKSRGKAKKG